MSSQQGTLFDVLKNKMRQTKEEAEKFQEEAEEYRKKLQVEIRRREEVSLSLSNKLNLITLVIKGVVYQQDGCLLTLNSLLQKN